MRQSFAVFASNVVGESMEALRFEAQGRKVSPELEQIGQRRIWIHFFADEWQESIVSPTWREILS